MSGTRRKRQNLLESHLEEAKRLYALLTDGAPRAGYHVRRGLALRDAETKRPLRWSYTGEWRPARERHADGSETDRSLNPYVLQKHLLGKYDVAWQCPSWTSLVVFDIDRPEVTYDAGEGRDPERELQADTARDQVLAEIWDAFGFDKEKQPVVVSSPGGGYHVYLPLCRGEGAKERTWPAAWAREHIEHHLNQHGLELRPGRLELFPSGIRLRAPCGAGSALLAPSRPDFSDDLKLEPVHADLAWRRDRKTGESRRTLIRDVGPMVGAFCDAIEAARRPLDDWLGVDVESWDETWGPWGRQADSPRKKPVRKSRVLALSQHIEEVPKDAGPLPLPSFPPVSSSPSSGWLLYGAEFRGRIQDLTGVGLTSPGERHDAALKLTWHWGKCRGLAKDETLERVREWLTAFEHASATRERSKHAFVRDTMREVSHYYDRHVTPAGRIGSPRGADVALRSLQEVDRRAVLPAVDPEVRKTAEVLLRFLRNSADREGRVPHPVNLSGKVLGAILGDRRIRVAGPDGVEKRRRASVVAIEELVRLGILALHTNYSTGHHGRLFTCWYQFGSGKLPGRTSDWLLLGERDVEEGRLQVLGDGDGAISCRLAAVRDEIGAARATALPWWARMYQRRAFTPAEFFEGQERRVIPGPFRHRWDPSSLEVVGEDASHRQVADSPSPKTDNEVRPLVEEIPPEFPASDGNRAGPSPGSADSGGSLGCAGAAPSLAIRDREPQPDLASPPTALPDLFTDLELKRQVQRTWQAWLHRKKE